MNRSLEEIEACFDTFYSYWDSIRKDGIVPLRKDFLPEKVYKLLPYIGIAEYVSETEIISRLRGSDIVRRQGQDLTGQNVVPYLDPAARPLLIKALHNIVYRPCGIRSTWMVKNTAGRQANILGLYLPLASGENGHPCAIMISFESEYIVWDKEGESPILGSHPNLTYIDIGAGIPGNN